MKSSKKSKSTKGKSLSTNIKTTNFEKQQIEDQFDNCQCSGKCQKNGWITWLLGMIVVFMLFSDGWPIVAIVNFKPILRSQLNATMNARYGKQTLEQMISEQLIGSEASKQKISVTKDEIDSKTNEIVKGLGENISLDDLLSYQGMTKADFENQLKLQLVVTKLLGKNVTVTDQEVSDYISKNQSLLTATNEADLKEEAKSAIIDQKVTEQLQTWFQELKAKAKIFRLL